MNGIIVKGFIMRKVWEANGVDYNTPDEAIKAIEEIGRGRVVQFILEPNTSGHFPKFIARSNGMWSYNHDGDGKWWYHCIWDGRGDKIREEKPN